MGLQKLLFLRGMIILDFLNCFCHSAQSGPCLRLSKSRATSKSCEDSRGKPCHGKTAKTVKKVENFKNRLHDPSGKQRSKVTQFIAQNKSRQESLPPLGKYVDIIKPDPLHNTNNAWQQWFMTMLAVAMQYTENNQLKCI